MTELEIKSIRQIIQEYQVIYQKNVKDERLDKEGVFVDSLKTLTLFAEKGLTEKFEKARRTIGTEAFDGWIENTGEYADGFEEHVQLLKEDVAQDALKELEAFLVEVFAEAKKSLGLLAEQKKEK